MNIGLGPPSVTARVFALTSIKAASVPEAFTRRKQKEVGGPESPAIVLAYQGAAKPHVLPCGHMGLFCMDLAGRLVMEQRHLGPTLFLPTALAVNPSLSLSFIKLTIFMHPLYSVIQTSLPDWNFAEFAVLGRLCCCCHLSRTHFETLWKM